MHSFKNISIKKSNMKALLETKNLSPSKPTDSTDNSKFSALKPLKTPIKPLKSMQKNDLCSKTTMEKEMVEALNKQKMKKRILKHEKKKSSTVFKMEEADLHLTTNEAEDNVNISKTSANFVCKYCCQRFLSIELLRDHSSSHGDTPTYVCYQCGHEAGAFSSLMAHFVKHSRIKKTKALKTNKTHNKLMDSSHSLPLKTPIRCSHCKVSFSSSNKLASHHCSVSIEKSDFNCAYCGQISVTVEEYRLHVLSHSVTPFFCMHCNFKSPTKKMLDKHNEICKKRPKKVVKNVFFKCEVCSLECKHKKELNYHMKQCKKTSIKTNLSDSVMNVEKNLEVAATGDINEKEELISCSLCGEIFDNQSDHESHKLVCFNEKDTLKEKESVLCANCGEMVHKAAIEDHTKTCHFSPESRKDCESDSDSPSKRRSARLVTRKISFSEEVPVIKEEIEKLPRKRRKFRQDKTMFKPASKKISRRGRQSKLGNDNFKCVYCDLTFCSKSTLLRHKRMHSGNPYFSCKYCGKFFFRKDVYTRHEGNVHNKTGTDVFCCFYCRQYFQDAQSLKEHVLSIHREDSFLPIKRENIDNKSIFREIKTETINDEIGTEVKKNVVSNIADSVENVSTTQLEKNEDSGISSENVVDIKNSSLYYHKIKDSRKSPEKDKMCVNQDSEAAKISNNASLHVTRRKLPRRSVKDNILTTVDISANSKMDSTEYNCIPKDFCIEGDETQTQEYICKLCSNKYSSQLLLSSHEQNEEHRVVDWYQCLVCHVSGPKKDMVDHMFSHMYQLGTLVVSSNSNNLGSFLNTFKDVSTSENENISSPVENEISSKVPIDELGEYELPPLIDYGPGSSNNTIVTRVQTFCQTAKNRNKKKVLGRNKDSLLKSEIEQDEKNHSLCALSLNQYSQTGNKSDNDEHILSKPQYEKEENTIRKSIEDLADTSNYLEEESLPNQFQNNVIQVGTGTDTCYSDLQHQTPSQYQAQILQNNSKSKFGDSSNNTVIKSKKRAPRSQNKISKKNNTSSNINSKILKKSGNSLKLSSKKSSPKSTKDASNSPNIKKRKMPVQGQLDEGSINIDLVEVSTKESLQEAFLDVLSSEKHQSEVFDRSQSVVGSGTTPNLLIEEQDSSFSHLRYLLEDKTPERLTVFPETEPSNVLSVDKTSQKGHFPELQSLLKTVTSVDSFPNIDTVNCFNMPQSNINISIDSFQGQLDNKTQEKGNSNLSSFNRLTSTKYFSASKNTDEPTTSNRTSPQISQLYAKDILNTSIEKHQESSQNLNTCLKFDINQCRGEFSENRNLSTQKHIIEKPELTDMFSEIPVQSTILDFSDLLKFGDSINPSEESIFQCEPLDSPCNSNSTLYNLCSNSPAETSDRLKCKSCDQKFDSGELSQHYCSKNVSPVSYAEETYNFDPKGIFLPSPSKLFTVGSNNQEWKSPMQKNSSIDSIACELSFSSNKMFMQHKQDSNSFPSNMCQKCYRTFSDSSECAKHFLGCQTPFLHRENDCLKPSEMLQSLLAVKDLRTNHKQNQSLPPQSDSVLNLSKNAFNS